MRQRLHYGYVIVACCCLIMGVNVGLVMSCAGIFYQPVSEGLGVSVGTFGLFMSFNYLASTLMLSVAGRMMKRYGSRRMLTLSSAVLGITMMSMSMYQSVWQFYVAGAIIGATMAFLLYLSFPTLVNRWFLSRVGFFIGVCSAASGIGGILFNPVGAWLITTYGWRTTYVVFGLCILFVITPLLALFLRDNPEDKGLEPYGTETEHQTVTSDKGIEYRQAVRMPVFYALIAFAFLMISVSTLNLFLPRYVQGLDFSLEQASLMASAVMVGVTIGKVVLGIINDRLGSHAGVIVSTLLGIAGLGLLLAGSTTYPLVVVGGFLFGWAYAAVTVQTPMLVRSVFGNRDYAQIYSNVSIAFAAGGAIMSGVWGLLADNTSYDFILAVGIVLLLICGVIGWTSSTIYEKKQKALSRCS